MRSLLSACALSMVIVLLFHGQIASAAESASFQLYDSFPNVGNPAPDLGHSFLMNENGVTWVAQPVTSQHFQIVAGPAVSSSSSSIVSSAASASSVSSAAPAAGGHRGAGTTTTGSPAHKQSRGRIPAVRPSAPARGSALPVESKPGGGSTVISPLRGVPPHHYRQPVEALRSSAPFGAMGPLWLHYRQRFLSTLSASLLGEGHSGTTWTVSIGVLCALIQLLVLVFIERRHRRTQRHSPRKR